MIETVWIVINLVTLFLTAVAFVEARADQLVIKNLNGKAREMVSQGITRREGLRVVVQLLLLLAVVPTVFKATSFGWVTLFALMSVPVVLLLASVLDARGRRALIALTAADVLSDRESSMDRIERALAENTEISQKALDHADAAFDANHKDQPG